MSLAMKAGWRSMPDAWAPLWRPSAGPGWKWNTWPPLTSEHPWNPNLPFAAFSFHSPDTFGLEISLESVSKTRLRKARLFKIYSLSQSILNTYFVPDTVSSGKDTNVDWDTTLPFKEPTGKWQINQWGGTGVEVVERPGGTGGVWLRQEVRGSVEEALGIWNSEMKG